MRLEMLQCHIRWYLKQHIWDKEYCKGYILLIPNEPQFLWKIHSQCIGNVHSRESKLVSGDRSFRSLTYPEMRPCKQRRASEGLCNRLSTSVCVRPQSQGILSRSTPPYRRPHSHRHTLVLALILGAPYLVPEEIVEKLFQRVEAKRVTRKYTINNMEEYREQTSKTMGK